MVIKNSPINIGLDTRIDDVAVANLMASVSQTARFTVGWSLVASLAVLVAGLVAFGLVNCKNLRL
jgi:hypothetical protein